MMEGAMTDETSRNKPGGTEFNRRGLLKTGDVTHLSKPEEFDTAEQIMKGAKFETHYVPGEHDVIGDDGKQFFARFAKKATPGGWYSFDQGGVHFVGLVNVLTFEKAKAGGFGADQLEW